MGVISYYFISTEDELNQCDYINQSPDQYFKSADIKGLDTVKIALLQSLLTGEDFYESLEQQEIICDELDQGPLMIKIPEKLILELAQFRDQDLEPLVNDWIQEEEFTYDKFDVPALKKIFLDIQSLSIQAQSEQKQCYLWMKVFSELDPIH